MRSLTEEIENRGSCIEGRQLRKTEGWGLGVEVLRRG
jgi:hypothetical protein